MRRLIMRSISAAFVLLLVGDSWAARDNGRTGLNPAPALQTPAAYQAPIQKLSGPAGAALFPIRAADVAQAVRTTIGEAAQPHDGWCRINDPVDNTSLELMLKHVPADKLIKVQPDTFVTGAAFEAANGMTYDVDFYVKGTTRQNLKVIDATIRSKNGLQRYAWVDEKGFARVKAISSEMPMREELAH